MGLVGGWLVDAAYARIHENNTQHNTPGGFDLAVLIITRRERLRIGPLQFALCADIGTY